MFYVSKSFSTKTQRVDLHEGLSPTASTIHRQSTDWMMYLASIPGLLVSNCIVMRPNIPLSGLDLSGDFNTAVVARSLTFTGPRLVIPSLSPLSGVYSCAAANDSLTVLVRYRRCDGTTWWEGCGVSSRFPRRSGH